MFVDSMRWRFGGFSELDRERDYSRRAVVRDRREWGFRFMSPGVRARMSPGASWELEKRIASRLPLFGILRLLAGTGRPGYLHERLTVVDGTATANLNVRRALV